MQRVSVERLTQSMPTNTEGVCQQPAVLAARSGRGEGQRWAGEPAAVPDSICEEEDRLPGLQVGPEGCVFAVRCMEHVCVRTSL